MERSSPQGMIAVILREYDILILEHDCSSIASVEGTWSAGSQSRVTCGAISSLLIIRRPLSFILCLPLACSVHYTLI